MPNPQITPGAVETKQVESPEDILLVSNIDIDCDDIDSVDGWEHEKSFCVKWAGHYHCIAPGKTRLFPRYLAEHYAKHLADHILLKREEERGKPGLLQSSIERPKVVNQIILGVEEYYGNPLEADEGAATAAKVGQMNEGGDLSERPALDAGFIPNKALGVLKPETNSKKPKPAPKEVVEPSSNDAQVQSKDASIFDPSRPAPTHEELIQTATDLSIDLTGKETTAQLISKIKSF